MFENDDRVFFEVKREMIQIQYVLVFGGSSPTYPFTKRKRKTIAVKGQERLTLRKSDPPLLAPHF